MNKISKKIIIGLFLSCAMTSIAAYFTYTKFFYRIPSNGIFEFDKKRDGNFVLNMFKDKENWYWLIAEGSPFSPELMIETQGYPQENNHKGNLHIDIGYDNNRPVGFVAYYPTSIVSGRVLFLLVDESQRTKGWGRKLLNHAVQAFKKQGINHIELVTRLSNVRAQGLYTSYGFKKIRNFGPEGAFLEFSYDVKE